MIGLIPAEKIYEYKVKLYVLNYPPPYYQPASPTCVERLSICELPVTTEPEVTLAFLQWGAWCFTACEQRWRDRDLVVWR